jgi:subtilisin family serine protease
MLRMLRVAAALAGLATACAGVLTLGTPPASADSVRDGQQWVLDMLGAPATWAASQGKGVTVAVLDSGVDPGVSDLAGSVATGPDLTGVSTPASSPDWGQHGTWMASLIAGHGHGAGGDSGIIGVAPESKILSVRVIPDKNDPGYGTYEHEQEPRVQASLADGIRYAVDHGADVVSMSIGYSVPSAAVRSALQYANGHGVVVVASSGNSGGTPFVHRHDYAPLSFPADYPGVIGVAAVGAGGGAAGFSSGNLSVQVAAPGVNVPAQGRDGQYWLVSGTSPACALVAGVAALIKSRYPGLAPDLVARALSSTTRYRPAAGYDQQVGFGTVDAAAALSAASQLSVERAARTGVAATAEFGGGPSGAAADPVQPRGTGSLVLFAVLALTALALVAAAVSRLAVLKRVRRRYPYAEEAPVGRPAPAAEPFGWRAAAPVPGAPPSPEAGGPGAGGPGAVARAPGMAPRSRSAGE